MKNLRIGFIKTGIYIGKSFLNIIYSLIKLCHSKNKVIMMSRQSNNPNLDFILIEKEIIKRNKDVKIKMLCKKISKGFFAKIGYGFYILKCMYNLATARVCILDGYSIPVSILRHKKNLEIIQIWHAAGAIKKFGYQALNKEEGRAPEVARLMNMHKNYSHVMAPSFATAEFYKEAFGINDDKIFINGMPRLDYIQDKEIGNKKQEMFFEDYPEYKDKKTILYVPTFRVNSDNQESIKKLIDSVDSAKYNLLLRFHPLNNDGDEFERYLVDWKYNTSDLIRIADYIITDYSAVAFEACMLDKPLYFYVYDINEYRQTRGLNIDPLDEMNNCSSMHIKELIRAIENYEYDFEELKRFKQKYIGTSTSSNTEKLVDFIFNYLDLSKDIKDEKIKNNSNEYSKKELNI